MEDKVFNTNNWILFKRLQFWSILESFNLDFKVEKTLLVLDRKLVGIFSLLFTTEQLKEKGIDNFIYFDDQIPLIDQYRNIIYLCKPRLELIGKLVSQISITTNKLLNEKQQQQQKFKLIGIPKVDCGFQYLLEREGLLGILTLDNYDMGFIAYDNDLLSLELSDFFSKSFIDNDNYQIESISKSIIQLEQLYGPFQNIIGKGIKSKLLCDNILHLQSSVATSPSGSSGSNDVVFDQQHSKLKTLILLDRTLDLLPILTTQQSYQGLIDDFFSISSSCSITLDEENDDQEENNNNNNNGGGEIKTKIKKKIFLDSNNILFSNLKNFNFSIIPSILHNNAISLNDSLQGLKLSNQQLSIPNLKQLVSKIPSIQNQKDSISTHTMITEKLMKQVNQDDFQNKIQFELDCIMGGVGSDSSTATKILEYIQNSISRKKPIHQVLRLISIYCLTIGMSSKTYQLVIKDFLHTYHYDSMTTLLRMEKAGLIGPKESLYSYSNHQIFKKSFKLTNNTINSQPNDDNGSSSGGGYNNNNTSLKSIIDDETYYGYVPAITRIIERGQKEKQMEWSNIESKISPILTPFFNYQITSSNSVKYDNNSSTMIFFVGGVTYSEISSLRSLKKIYGRGVGYDFIFGTTNISNGNNFIMNL